MDLQIIEHHPQRVLEALRRGEFDGLEIVGEADEKEFFERLFREKLLEELAATMPTAREKEDATKTKIQALSKNCHTHWTGVENTGKRLAGDGVSCGRDKDWEF